MCRFSVIEFDLFILDLKSFNNSNQILLNILDCFYVWTTMNLWQIVWSCAIVYTLSPINTVFIAIRQYLHRLCQNRFIEMTSILLNTNWKIDRQIEWMSEERKERKKLRCKWNAFLFLSFSQANWKILYNDWNRGCHLRIGKPRETKPISEKFEWKLPHIIRCWVIFARRCRLLCYFFSISFIHFFFVFGSWISFHSKSTRRF